MKTSEFIEKAVVAAQSMAPCKVYFELSPGPENQLWAARATVDGVDVIEPIPAPTDGKLRFGFNASFTVPVG